MICCVVVCIVCFVLFYMLFVCKCVLLPGDNPIAVNKYIITVVYPSFYLQNSRKLGLSHSEKNNLVFGNIVWSKIFEYKGEKRYFSSSYLLLFLWSKCSPKLPRLNQLLSLSEYTKIHKVQKSIREKYKVTLHISSCLYHASTVSKHCFIIPNWCTEL